jgi:putrescine aminotransferase
VVIDEVQRQLNSHPVASRMFMEPSLARAAQALIGVTPRGLNRVHFSGSGAEAVEAAIKLARASGRDHLVSMNNGYHGKTMGALSVTAKPMFQDPFRPLLSNVSHVPFGDVAALEAVLSAHAGRACVIVEPVQGEAGVIIPPPGYLRAVAALCARFDALFVLDEIQTGFGRLGSWWGADLEDVVPDVLLSGKGLGGGVMPVAATIATAEAFGVLDRDPYLHTSTFSGNPLAMAAVCGAVAALHQDDLVARAALLGTQLLPEVRNIVVEAFGELVREVRGVGLLIGIEFTDAALAGELLIELVHNRVIANHSLNSHCVLRLTPPAILTEAEVHILLEALRRAAGATAAHYHG